MPAEGISPLAGDLGPLDEAATLRWTGLVAAAAFVLAHADLLTLYVILGVGLAAAAAGLYAGASASLRNR